MSCRLATIQVAANFNHAAVALNNSVMKTEVDHDNPFWPSGEINPNHDGFGASLVDSEDEDESPNKNDKDEEESSCQSYNDREMKLTLKAANLLVD
jgi:hypothetical protein